MMDSADAWVVNGKNKSPAFVLASRGYDVWLGNSRGSKFSRKHTVLDPDASSKDERRRFWDFSFQEMAEYDGQAFLDKIHEVSGMKKVNWIGHGMGAT